MRATTRSLGLLRCPTCGDLSRLAYAAACRLFASGCSESLLDARRRLEREIKASATTLQPDRNLNIG